MSLPLPEKQEPEKWIRELKAAGWTQERLGLWRSPDGGYYRGPYFAWYMMKREQEGEAVNADVEAIVATTAVRADGTCFSVEALKSLADGKRLFWSEARQALVWRGPLSELNVSVYVP